MPPELPHFIGPLHSTEDMERLRDAVQGLLNMTGYRGVQVEFAGSTPVVSPSINQLAQFLPRRPIFYGVAQHISTETSGVAWKATGTDGLARVDVKPCNRDGSMVAQDTIELDCHHNPDYDPNVREDQIIQWTTGEDGARRITVANHEDGKVDRAIRLWAGTLAQIPGGWALVTDAQDKLIKGAADDAELETTGGSLTHHHDLGTGAGGVAQTIQDVHDSNLQVLDETIDLPPWFALHLIKRVN